MTSPGFSATVDLSEVERLLSRLATGADRVAEEAGRETANVVAGRVRARLPRRTGRLAASVSVTGADQGATLAVSTPYAAWIEYGGSRGRAFVSGGRYVGPAAEGSERLYAENCADGLDRILR